MKKLQYEFIFRDTKTRVIFLNPVCFITSLCLMAVESKLFDLFSLA